MDIYWAPQNKVEGYDCERFDLHLGPFEEFVSSDPSTRDIDSYGAPLKFGNTYNGHSFVARLSHDNSLVARIDVDHDVVRDCPDPAKRTSAFAEVWVDESVMQGAPMTVMANSTESSRESKSDWLSVQVNVTDSPSIASAKPLHQKHDLLFQNRTAGIMAASAPLAS